jgi:tetratricopeptide (TPR) repeat protein/tRNA A-37 threonylcarbamoyl transferase component Bud32
MDSQHETLVDSEVSGRGQTFERGAQLGRHVVLEPLGSGAMGVVYAAYDPELDRRIAVKLLRSADDALARERLIREAQAMAKLSHPNVISVLDVGSAGGRVFVAMELIDGVTLGEAAARERADWRAIRGLYVQAGLGLSAAHAVGLIHRDFKPTNAMVSTGGTVKVLDFGLARRAADGTASGQPEGQLERQLEGSTRASDLTATGAILGTPAYMAPEQFKSSPADERSDQFSFCVALYEALYGRRPFAGDSPAALAMNVLRGEPLPPPKDTRVPARLWRALERGLSRDPSERHASMDALLDALSEERSRLPGALTVGALGVLLLAGAALLRAEDPDHGCDVSAAGIDEAWNDERRARVRDAFTASGAAYAADSFTLVASRLDQVVASWKDRATASCMDARVHRRQSEADHDLRMRCLMRRGAELGSLVDAFEGADATVVRKAAEAAADADDGARCDDVERLRAGIEPPPEGAGRDAAEQIETLARKAKAAADTGKPERVVEIVREMTEMRDGIDHAPTRAVVDLWRGRAAFGVGELEPARAHLEDAYFGAMGVHPEVAAEAAVALVSVVGSRFTLSDPDTGRAWARHAEGAVRQVLGAELLEAKRLRHLSQIETMTRGNKDEAVQTMRASIALYEQELGEHHPNLIRPLRDLGFALGNAGMQDEALATYERALRLSVEGIGAQHPSTGALRSNYGGELLGAGRVEEALIELEAGLTIFEASLPPTHGNIASAQINLADGFRRVGRYEEAHALMDRAVEVRRATLGEDATLFTWTLLHRARVANETANAERALRAAEEAVASARAHADTRPGWLLEATANEGEALLALGRPRVALQRLEACIADYDVRERPEYWLAVVVRAHAERANGTLDTAAATAASVAAILSEHETRGDSGSGGWGAVERALGRLGASP